MRETLPLFKVFAQTVGVVAVRMKSRGHVTRSRRLSRCQTIKVPFGRFRRKLKQRWLLPRTLHVLHECAALLATRFVLFVVSTWAYASSWSVSRYLGLHRLGRSRLLLTPMGSPVISRVSTPALADMLESMEGAATFESMAKEREREENAKRNEHER